jgi:hypothetical protein
MLILLSLLAAPNRKASLECRKGLGRLSILYFGTMWSFMNKDGITHCEEVKADFARPGIKPHDTNHHVDSLG